MFRARGAVQRRRGIAAVKVLRPTHHKRQNRVGEPPPPRKEAGVVAGAIWATALGTAAAPATVDAAAHSAAAMPAATRGAATIAAAAGTFASSAAVANLTNPVSAASVLPDYSSTQPGACAAAPTVTSHP